MSKGVTLCPTTRPIEGLVRTRSGLVRSKKCLLISSFLFFREIKMTPSTFISVSFLIPLLLPRRKCFTGNVKPVVETSHRPKTVVGLTRPLSRRGLGGLCVGMTVGLELCHSGRVLKTGCFDNVLFRHNKSCE